MGLFRARLPKNIKGVGKVREFMDEFIKTGTCARLEDYLGRGASCVDLGEASP